MLKLKIMQRRFIESMKKEHNFDRNVNGMKMTLM